ncbi:MAG: hypothetical protein AMK72_03210 [Planctomycetes bacterium SM23_25]|nr:MAG: hypothetical protein AMK72_03210 [Planctomycetes bacterium SM23_25]
MQIMIAACSAKASCGVLIAAMAAITLVVGRATAQERPRAGRTDTKRNRYLLLDSRIIESSHNAKLTVGAVRKDKHNPLMKEDRPWEPYYSNLYGKVVYDEQDKLFKCWYSIFIESRLESDTPRAKRAWAKWTESPRAGGVCYATSKDGIHWEKPNLGVIDFQGSKQNNIVLRAPHGVTVIKDPHEANPQKRYKAILPSRAATKVWFSPDGIHWKLHKLPGLDYGDTHNCVFRDSALKKYVLFTRRWTRKPIPGKRYGRYGYRQVSRSESPDFLNWSKARVVFEGPSVDRQIHDLIVFPHAGVYLGLVGLFDLEADRQHVELAWSPDGIQWHWVCQGAPLIANSPHVGDYDWGCIFATTPIFQKDRVLLYYGGSANRFFGWRDSFLCRASLRPDGFAGYEQVEGGSNKTATITTKPVRAVTGSLRLSADLAAAGYVRVTILDKENRELAQSERIARTVTDAEVRWPKGFSFEKLKGDEIRLRFELRDAKVYSFSFDD